MMLLQAGQLELYRKDSIWTDEIPPGMVSGATMWIDFTDPASVFADGALGGGNVTVDGAAVNSVRDNVSSGGIVDSGGAPAKLALAATPNGQQSVIYEGDATVGDILHTYQRIIGATTSASTLFTTTTKLIIACIRVSHASAPTGVVSDASVSVFSDDGYAGIYITDGSGVLAAHAFNWPSGPTVASQTIARDAWVVVTMSHQSGQLRCRVNGGVWATTASGATENLTSSVRAVVRGASIAPGKIEYAHLATFNTAQTDAVISAVEHWLALDVGITPWW